MGRERLVEEEQDRISEEETRALCPCLGLARPKVSPRDRPSCVTTMIMVRGSSLGGGLPSGQGELTTRTKSRQDASDGNYSGDVEGMFSRGIGDKPFESQVKLASGFGASG
jgi:hypothetical protein